MEKLKGWRKLVRRLQWWHHLVTMHMAEETGNDQLWLSASAKEAKLRAELSPT